MKTENLTAEQLLLALRPTANPFLESALAKASAHLAELWAAVPPEKVGSMDDRTKLLLTAANQVDELLGAVRAELALARRRAEALAAVEASR